MDLFTAMRTFVEVSHAGSMNAAAQRLNVTGALVGQRIAALEDHLQVRLLNRTTRQQSLTDFGESYLEQCKDILEHVARSEGRASDQQREPEGRLTITAPFSFGTTALVDALSEFKQNAPKIEIELVVSDTNEDLIAGGIDLAFRIGPLDDSTLMQTRLAPYRMVACAAPGLLDAAGPPAVPADLDRFQAILFSKSGRKLWRFSQGPDTQTWQPKSSVTMNAGHAVRAAALSAMGVALLPHCLVEADLAAGTLVQLLPDWTAPERPMSLVYHRDRYRPQRLVHFIDFARTRFAA